MRSSLLGCWLLVFGAVLVGCSKAPTISRDVLTDAEPIPIAIGQALVLKDKLETGTSLQTAADLSMVSEIVYDLLGTPFYQLTVVNQKSKDKKFWDVIQNYDSSSSYSLYGTGASDIRGLYNFEFQNDAIAKLKRTKELAGSYKRLVSPAGALLYMQDASDKYWDVWSGTEVSQTRLDGDRLSYLRIKEAFENSPTLVDETKKAWKKAKGDGSGIGLTGQSATFNWQSFTQEDGNLDIRKLTAHLSSKSSGVGSQGVSAQGDYKWCEGLLCSISVYAHVASRNDSDTVNWSDISNDSQMITNRSYDPWGNYQLLVDSSPYANQIAPNGGIFKADPFNNGGTWGMRDFLPTGLVYRQFCYQGGSCYQYAINGCASQTFTRLMGWYYRRKNNVYDQNVKTDPSLTSYATANAMALDMQRPVQADNAPSNVYESYLSKIMGAGSMNGSATVITPNGFLGITGGGLLGGANTWLSGKNSRYRLEGPMYHFDWAGTVGVVLTAGFRAIDPAFNSWTWTVHNYSRKAIHDKNEPAIALFHATNVPWDNGYNGHYPLVFAYKNYANLFYVDVHVWVDSLQEGSNITPNGWVNITNRWDTMGGIWGLSTAAPSPPPPPPPSCNPQEC